MHARGSFRDPLPGLRDDGHLDPARDGLVHLLAEAFAYLGEGRCGHHERLRRLVEKFPDLLQDPRLRCDRVYKLGFSFLPQDLVEKIELREGVLQVVDDTLLHLTR